MTALPPAIPPGLPPALPRRPAEVRIREAADAVGHALDEAGAAPLAAFVERVEAALAAPLDLPAPHAAVGTPAPLHGGGASTGDEARESAWMWRRAPGARTARPGPLSGVRLAVKDLIDLAGHPRRAGSAATASDPVPSEDAPVVRALLDAGAELEGAVKLHEFAFGTSGINAAFGTPANPNAPGRVPGGSSSGSGAAIAAGEADLALGTDTGGSVRIPAALCGVAGIKPTFGAVSTVGVFALSPSLDHVGWLAPSAFDLRPPGAVLGICAPASTRPPGPARFGVARSALTAASDAVRDACEQAFSALLGAGHELVDVDWPGGDSVFAATTAIMFAEASFLHRTRLRDRAADYGPDVLARLVQGAAFDLDAYLTAQAVRGVIGERCRAVFATVDAVVGPTVPVEAPLLSEAVDPAVGAQLVAFTRLADLNGHAAVSLPVPGRPLPVGLQLEASTDEAAITLAELVASALGDGSARG